MAKRKKRPRGPQLEIAGSLCVAFVNTAAARTKNRQQGIDDYSDLLIWGRQAGVLSANEGEHLAGRAAEKPTEAKEVFERATSLRSCLLRMLRSIAVEEAPTLQDLGAISKALAEAMPAICLVPGQQGVTYGWAGDGDALDRMLWPVLHSSADFLTSLEGQPLVRQCAAKGCDLFFAIRTPGIKRPWCEMKTCGNRVKSLRHYHRAARLKRQIQDRRDR